MCSVSDSTELCCQNLHPHNDSVHTSNCTDQQKRQLFLLLSNSNISFFPFFILCRIMAHFTQLYFLKNLKWNLVLILRYMLLRILSSLLHSECDWKWNNEIIWSTGYKMCFCLYLCVGKWVWVWICVIQLKQLSDTVDSYNSKHQFAGN